MLLKIELTRFGQQIIIEDCTEWFLMKISKPPKL